MRESLEEAFSNYVNEKYHFPIQDSIPDLESARFGAKWQQKNSYSEEEVDKLISDFKHDLTESASTYLKQNCEGAIFGLERLKQFKKK